MRSIPSQPAIRSLCIHEPKAPSANHWRQKRPLPSSLLAFLAVAPPPSCCCGCLSSLPQLPAQGKLTQYAREVASCPALFPDSAGQPGQSINPSPREHEDELLLLQRLVF
ncbi:hypothetical protein GUJ93_ZPchr0002g25455 [Zizania palustris]|uniref:Uncharacterized protein n=1 Tax=Zizania palustris TaxID=103762 RepID=A0A8J5V4X9_ZIZPA|nr:hypothetical protein GUJ93_ZPchr0002g25455 [Zizania palustris]